MQSQTRAVSARIIAMDLIAFVALAVSIALAAAIVLVATVLLLAGRAHASAAPQVAHHAMSLVSETKNRGGERGTRG